MVGRIEHPNPAADTDIRQKHIPAHLAFLEENRDRIKAAGPLPVFGGGSGGLWKSVRELAWKQVFANGKKLI